MVLDSFKKHQMMILFFLAFVHGLTIMSFPHLKYILIYYIMGSIKGIVSNSLRTGGNALCLNTWSEDKAGPWLHSIHFSYAIGVSLAPLVAIPFLRSNPTDEYVCWYLKYLCFDTKLFQDQDGN